jgi:hypothetical protein
MTPNTLLHEKHVIFAGIARDCEKFLPKVLETINQLSDLFKESAYVFLENDSTDGTKKLFYEWGQNKSNFTFLNMDGLGQLPIRTLRLEYLRNACVQFIKNDSALSQFDYLIVLDMDDVNSSGLDPARIKESILFLDQKEDRAAIFANQDGTYYDMWALRHKIICPKDIWEEIFEYVQEFKVDDEIAYQNTFQKRIFSLGLQEDYLEVESAFGGLGVYKLSYVIKNPNPYLGSKVKVTKNDAGIPMIFRFQSCEHVHFNLGIRSIGGHLFIKPNLINSKNTGLQFPPSAFRSLIF